MDVTANSGGLLVYFKESLLGTELQAYKIPFDIQATPFQINLGKENWLLIGICKPPSQTDNQYFLNISADLLDVYWMQYDNKVLLGKFNLKLNNPIMLDFLV